MGELTDIYIFISYKPNFLVQLSFLVPPYSAYSFSITLLQSFLSLLSCLAHSTMLRSAPGYNFICLYWPFPTFLTRAEQKCPQRNGNMISLLNTRFSIGRATEIANRLLMIVMSTFSVFKEKLKIKSHRNIFPWLSSYLRRVAGVWVVHKTAATVRHTPPHLPGLRTGTGYVNG